jgi:hypothetical protein
LVGVDVMARAYQAIRPLRPPYGQDISQAVADAFLSQVPDALKSQVAFKLARLQ